MTNTNASKIYAQVGAEAVLTEQPDLRFYLTGFESSFGYVLTDKNGSVFYTDPRYIEAAQAALKGTEIKVELFQGSLSDVLKPYKEVAVPLARTYYPVYKKITDSGKSVKDSLPAFTRSMSVKQPYELENIKNACRITDKAFNALLGNVKEGMTENELAAELEYLMRKFGASGTSFDTIVAFGANSSVPHHETGETRLKFGDVVLIDFGCKYGGYCSDCTRTVLFGDNGKCADFKKAYSHVLKAHMLVKDKLTDGMTGREADAVARGYLKSNGLAEYFTHSLGHGIGINIHEFPALSMKSDDILKNGMVFSDEPGVYFQGRFGIRIEDSVTLQSGAVESLTDSDKSLIIL